MIETKETQQNKAGKSQKVKLSKKYSLYKEIPTMRTQAVTQERPRFGSETKEIDEL